jgi:hypothetical protein
MRAYPGFQPACVVLKKEHARCVRTQASIVRGAHPHMSDAHENNYRVDRLFFPVMNGES